MFEINPLGATTSVQQGDTARPEPQLKPRAKRRLPLDLTGIGLSALGLILSFPPFELHVLVWIALVPLFLTIQHSGLLRVFVSSFAAGFVFFAGLLWWALRLDGFNPLNFTLAILTNAVFVAAFGLVARWFDASLPEWNAITFPVSWVLLEYVRSHLGFLAFPWGILGYSQYSMLPLAQVAAFTGVYGVSFLVVICNTAVAELVRIYASERHGRRWKHPAYFRIASGIVGVTGILGFAPFLYAFSSGGSVSTGSLSVALVQGNIPWSAHRNVEQRGKIFETYYGLTLKASESKPDLIAWPASSVPGRIPYDYVFVNLLSSLAQRTDSHLIVGSAGYDKLHADQGQTARTANSTFVFSPQGKILGRYDKIRLLPFDEYLPLRRYVKWPAWIANPNVIDLEPGRDLTIFATPKASFGIQDCWENLFPDLFRELTGRGLDFVVSATNEGFTEIPAAHYQMLAMNVFRAIENHVAIVRTATTGVSAVIDPTGRIVARVRDELGRDVNIPGYLVASVPLSRVRTFYTRHGDWFVSLLAAGLVGFTALAAARRRAGLG